MSKTSPTNLTRIAIEIPASATLLFETALEGFVQSLLWSVDDECVLQTMEGFTETAPDEALLQAALVRAASEAGIDAPVPVIEALEDRDWVAENLSEFPPIRIGRFFIHGAHIAARPLPGIISLRIDQSVAFGTGQHATTAGCLMAIERLCLKRTFNRVLDMGTGSGILALAAQRLTRTVVSATDIDARAIKVAAENARINRSARYMRTAQGVGYKALASFRHRYGPKAATTFDLIISNILARPLAAMAPDLAHHLEPGGYAVLSGLLVGDEARVLAAHRAQGLVFEQRIVLDGWLTMIMKKPPRAEQEPKP